jgi:membrane protease YdiL (CAAX protease family)
MFGYSPPDWINRSILVESIAVVPALLGVSRATQLSVLAMLGEKRKPLIALGANLGLGTAAGVGEESLFRGIIQGELVTLVRRINFVGRCVWCNTCCDTLVLYTCHASLQLCWRLMV